MAMGIEMRAVVVVVVRGGIGMMLGYVGCGLSLSLSLSWGMRDDGGSKDSSGRVEEDRRE